MANKAYEIVIKNKKGEKIELFKDDISAISFKVNSINDETVNRAKSVRVEFKIVGPIRDDDNNKGNTARVAELAKWALSGKENEVYRDVEIVVRSSATDSESTIIRQYKFTEMFVLDYIETEDASLISNDFGVSSEEGEEFKFVLWLGQKDSSSQKEVLPR